MKKRGFTLIELLAVMVVLAIIALIATPIILNTIRTSQKGSAERSAANYIGAVETWIATSSSNYAGFTSKPDSKYYDDYTTTDATTVCNGGICYGHALSGTSNWYKDSAYFVSVSAPWFLRGGSTDDGSDAGVFQRSINTGSGGPYSSFRVVCS